MKNCTKCNIEKSLNEFSKRTNGTLQSWCKVCIRAYNLSKYHSSNDEKARIAKNRKTQFKRGKDFIINYLSDKSCIKCGFDHPAALDFHHIDPNSKKKEVSKMKEYSSKTILKEIHKCEILCANCHRIHHFNNGAHSRG